MSYYDYWGKKDDTSVSKYHLLPYHCLDVAAVTKQLLLENQKLANDLAQLLELPTEQLINVMAFLTSLHDLGKFSSSFQAIDPCQALFSASKYDVKHAKHDRLGAFFWEQVCIDVVELLVEQYDDEDEALERLEVLITVVLGHHGYPISLDKPNALKRYTEPRNVRDVKAFIDDVYALSAPKLSKLPTLERLRQASWYLAGVVVIADWIGSNQRYFAYCDEKVPLQEYWRSAQEKASNALIETGFSSRARPSEFKSIQEHFGFEPTPLQQWAEQVPLADSPQLFILEDVTGAGKTEAALALTHRLMAQGVADGFYFGLPTMATSNAMFQRIMSHYHDMYQHDTKTIMPSLVLAQSSSALSDPFQAAKSASCQREHDYYTDEHTATAICNAWLADSRKAALLASVGVGTIDQALLAILPKHHQALRLLGLHRKVLIFDEVHAADEYMFILLESLLEQHLHHGGSVILLTATLSTEQRQKLVNIWLRTGQLPPSTLTHTDVTDFPLTTQVSLTPLLPVIETPLMSRDDVCRQVMVSQIHGVSDCIQTIVNAVKAGQCAVWVRNSVDDARSAYDDVKLALESAGYACSQEQLMLFHSRFALSDRKRIEKQVLSCLGKKTENGEVISGEMRKGKVFITTQVFQESLDVDVDVMISDLCPIDDLIQRVGRLHRHTRDINGQFHHGIDQRAAPMLYLHAPKWEASPNVDWLSLQFRNTEYVYRSPGRLWLAQRKLIELGAIRMPDEARVLIEAVYSQDAQAEIPNTLLKKEEDLIAEERLKNASAKSQRIDFKYGYSDNSQKHWSEDQHDISTRFCERETIQVVVLRRVESGELTLWCSEPEHGVALSTLTVAKLKCADHLKPLTEQEHAELLRRFPPLKYRLPWCPEDDPQFGYNATQGFYQRSM